ncbi:MAG: c-type cytochrome, partial [Gammaproteobacteria bacterium]
MRRRITVLLIAGALSVFGGPAPATDAPVPVGVWDGVYTSLQADRGQERFASHCAQCHGQDSRSAPGVPGIVGAAFKATWRGKSVGQLMAIVRARMPPGEIGVLAEPEYVDVVAYLLRANGFPASAARELSADPAKLDQIAITERGGSAGKPEATLGDERHAIEQMISRFISSFENLELSAFMTHFSADATVFFPTPEPPQRFNGKPAIQQHFQKVFAAIRAEATSGPPYHRLVAEHLEIQLLGADGAVVSFELRGAE